MASERKNSQYYTSICESDMDISGDNWDEVLNEENNEILTFIVSNTDRYFCISKKTFITSIIKDFINSRVSKMRHITDLNNINYVLPEITYIKFPFNNIHINKNIIQQVEDGYSLFYLYKYNPKNNDIYLSIPFNKNVLYQNNIQTIREMANSLLQQNYRMPEINLQALSYFRSVLNEIYVEEFTEEERKEMDEIRQRRENLRQMEDSRHRETRQLNLELLREQETNLHERHRNRSNRFQNVSSVEEENQRQRVRNELSQRLVANNPELQISVEERKERLNERIRAIQVEQTNFVDEDYAYYLNQFETNFLQEIIRRPHELTNERLERINNIHPFTIETKNLAFLIASRNGLINIANFFLRKGANVRINNNQALVEAVQKPDNINTITFLLNNGADIHANNEQPLQSASQLNLLNNVRLLLERGAIITLRFIEYVRDNPDEFIPAIRQLLELSHEYEEDREIRESDDGPYYD